MSVMGDVTPSDIRQIAFHWPSLNVESLLKGSSSRFSFGSGLNPPTWANHSEHTAERTDCSICHTTLLDSEMARRIWGMTNTRIRTIGRSTSATLRPSLQEEQARLFWLRCAACKH